MYRYLIGRSTGASSSTLQVLSCLQENNKLLLFYTHSNITHPVLLFNLTLLKMSHFPREAVFPVTLTSSPSSTHALTSNTTFTTRSPSATSTSSLLLSESSMLSSRLWGGALLSTIGMVTGGGPWVANLYPHFCAATGWVTGSPAEKN